MLVALAAGTPRRPTTSRPRRAPELPARVETHHTINLSGNAAWPLDYRAVAETIGSPTGKAKPSPRCTPCRYLADLPAGTQRPVAFVFNGGPGAASVFLHLGALGPRILDTAASGAVPSPPVRLVDNPSTWLRFTDLVFVDPVGTGFSRGKGKEENPDKPFWNVKSDLDSLGAVVRRWLTRHERWSAPVFLVGESYGGLRAAALAQQPGARRRRHGERPGADLAGARYRSSCTPISATRWPAAFALPSYAATAAALSGAESPAEAGARGRAFRPVGLSRRAGRDEGHSGRGDPFIARVAALIGLPDDIVRRERGRVLEPSVRP